MDTYSCQEALDMTFSRLQSLFCDQGVTRIYVKHLSPNDNSKNQPYLGGDYSSLGIIPTGPMTAVDCSSKKGGARQRFIFKAPVDFVWIGPDGSGYPAPQSKLILYPQYPEVRLSGFLAGSKVNLSRWMDPHKEGRARGRILVLGTTPSGVVFGYLIVPDCALARELQELRPIQSAGVFDEYPLTTLASSPGFSRQALLDNLRAIHQAGWILGQKLDRNGQPAPYHAPNGGGYTLEALLGVKPNGQAEPDFMGWEIKQFGVVRFERICAKIITLMTPNPTGGIYKEKGVDFFLQKFGYPDRCGRPDRINFGGIHRCNETCPLTRLKLSLEGYDPDRRIINAPDGGLVLQSSDGVIAAKWHFTGLIDHWKRKHAHAAYVPSMRRNVGGNHEYCYGKNILLGEGTDFAYLLGALANGSVYYDPGVKLEKASSAHPKSKQRHQFRIKVHGLESLYRQFETVDLLQDAG